MGVVRGKQATFAALFAPQFFLREKVRFYKNGTADKNNTNLAKRRQTTVRIIYILHRCGRYKKIGL